MSQTPTDSPYRWRAADLEGIRVALSIPARLPAIRAINDAMADLEQLYPDAIPTARREIDAIAAIDTELAGLDPEQLQAPIETRRKAVGPDALPEDGTLPVKKARAPTAVPMVRALPKPRRVISRPRHLLQLLSLVAMTIAAPTPCGPSDAKATSSKKRSAPCGSS
jgi:hypothetical protein